MRPTYIVHVEGSTPHLIDHWTKPYKTQSTAAAQATRLVFKPYPFGRSKERKGDFEARIYRLGREDYRGPDPGPELTLVQTIP